MSVAHTADGAARRPYPTAKLGPVPAFFRVTCTKIKMRPSAGKNVIASACIKTYVCWPVKANDLFALMPRPLAVDIVEFTFANDKEVYNAVLDMIAQAKKVRPVFLQRQARQERFESMVGALGRPNLELAGENLIRSWLLKKHTAMLTEFLDALKIPHDKGVVEHLPDTVEDEALRLAVEGLLANYPQDTVAIYLYAFNSMNETKWKNLEATLHSHPKLQFDA